MLSELQGVLVLAGDLIGRPFVSRPEVAKRYGVTGQGAANAIAALAVLDILLS